MNKSTKLGGILKFRPASWICSLTFELRISIYVQPIMPFEY